MSEYASVRFYYMELEDFVPKNLEDAYFVLQALQEAVGVLRKQPHDTDYWMLVYRAPDD